MAKLPEGVYMRGEKFWIRFTPIPGGPQIRMATGLSKKIPGAAGMAAALRSKLIKEAFEGRWFPGKAKDCTVGEAVTEYLDAISAARDAQVISKRLARAVDFFGKNSPISTVTHKQIRSWQRELETEKIRGGKTRETQSMLHFLVNLRSAFRLAVKSKLTSVNPMDGYPLPEVDNARSRIASEEEFERLVSGALDRDDEDLADAIILARELGLRRAKIIGMEWAGISGRIYSVPPSAGSKPKPVPKRVPLSRLAMLVLERRGMKKDGLVFPGLTGGQISMRFRSLVLSLGIKDLRFHDLRHTSFTDLERKGVGLRTIKEISGHKTVENLFRYQTVDDKDLLAAVDRIAEDV